MRKTMRILIPLAMAGSLIAAMTFANPASAVHPAPTGGATFHYPVVPAFAECLPPGNSVHGGTLPIFTSCNNPVALSVSATLGTSTTSGTRVGFGDIAVCITTTPTGLCSTANIGTAPDVRLRGNGSDVKCKIGTTAAGPCPAGAGSDYNPDATPGPYTSNLSPGTDSNSQVPQGVCRPVPSNPAQCAVGADMTAEANIPDNVGSGGDTIRVTDHFNTTPSTGDLAGCGGSQTCTGTVSENPFPVPVVCEGNGNTGGNPLGSYCGVNVTANSTVPGAVVAGKFAVVEIGQLQLYDIGTDLNRTASDDDGLFAVQGIFIP